MKRTHLSFYYLAGYALPSGLALLLAPSLTTKMLMSNATYPDVVIRLVGIPLAALGMFIVQIVRHRLEVLYTTTLFVRAFIIAGLVALYLTSGDPMFAVLTGVVAFGFVLTATCYLLDRRSPLPAG